MLVLTRLKDEAVIIGSGENAVRVQIVEIRGDKVRLGFDAPKSIPIHREEVYNAIHKKDQPEPETETSKV